MFTHEQGTNFFMGKQDCNNSAYSKVALAQASDALHGSGEGASGLQSNRGLAGVYDALKQYARPIRRRVISAVDGTPVRHR